MTNEKAFEHRDDLLEQQIGKAAHDLACAWNKEEKVSACKKLERLISNRSPEQVEKMEKEKGIYTQRASK